MNHHTGIWFGGRNLVLMAMMFVSISCSATPTSLPTQTVTIPPSATFTATPTQTPTPRPIVSCAAPDISLSQPISAVVTSPEGVDARLRDNPGGNIIETVTPGTTLEVLSGDQVRDADGVTWVQVRLETGETGWMSKLVLRFEPHASPNGSTPPNKYLFIDTSAIESLERVSRLVHPAVKCVDNPIPLDKPWEQLTGANTWAMGIYTVLFDTEEQIYKMWYGVYGEPLANGGDNIVTLYATSPDGINWNKPELGLFEYNGSINNNIIGYTRFGHVFKDYNEADPERRYKAFGGSPDGPCVYFSPDGIHWTAYASNPVIPLEWSDGGFAFYDERSQKYTAFIRAYVNKNDITRRAIALSTSTNFINWSEPEVVFAPDARDDQLAAALGFAYADIYGFGALFQYNGFYLGFPTIFQHEGLPGKPDENDGPLDIQLAFSRNLSTWQRPDRTPIIPRGYGGSFDSGIIAVAPSVLVVGSEIWLYYVGYEGTHLSFTNPVSALAKWRVDGFVSLANAGDTAGTITTKPLTVTADNLFVNADVTGSLRVEILDANGNTLPGFSTEDSVVISGDKIGQWVSWPQAAGLDSLQGRQVKLRFYLDEGDLYSFWFADESSP